jgi:uncharacterized protein (TIGR00251 family)
VKKEPEAKGVLPALVDRSDAVALRVRVQPRASREEVVGIREGALVVRLTAPPVDGAANKALARLLGKRLGLPPSAVLIAAGGTGRNKLVVVSGLSAKEALARLVAGPPLSRGEKP